MSGTSWFINITVCTCVYFWAIKQTIGSYINGIWTALYSDQSTCHLNKIKKIFHISLLMELKFLWPINIEIISMILLVNITCFT